MTDEEEEALDRRVREARYSATCAAQCLYAAKLHSLEKLEGYASEGAAWAAYAAGEAALGENDDEE